RVRFPKGMDANEYAQKVTPAEKSLGTVLRAAEWIGKGKASTQQALAPEQHEEPGRVEDSEDKTPPPSPPPAASQATKREKELAPEPPAEPLESPPPAEEEFSS